MSELQKQIKLIQKHYKTEELRTIFTKRLDDEMFEALGKMAKPLWEGERSEFVWTGYELATDSRYLGQ